MAVVKSSTCPASSVSRLEARVTALSAPGERFAAPVEELLLPLGDGRLAHRQASSDLDLGRLALEHGEDDGQFRDERPHRE